MIFVYGMGHWVPSINLRLEARKRGEENKLYVLMLLYGTYGRSCRPRLLPYDEACAAARGSPTCMQYSLVVTKPYPRLHPSRLHMTHIAASEGQLAARRVDSEGS